MFVFHAQTYTPFPAYSRQNTRGKMPFLVNLFNILQIKKTYGQTYHYPGRREIAQREAPRGKKSILIFQRHLFFQLASGASVTYHTTSSIC